MKTFVCEACGNVCVVASGDKEVPTGCPLHYKGVNYRQVAEKKGDSDHADKKSDQ